MKLLFEWDAKKAETNFKKHKVRFEEAKTVFNDPFLITYRDEEHSQTEERFISIGMSATNDILLVVHLEQEMTDEIIIIRIISCRKAKASERRIYEKGEK